MADEQQKGVQVLFLENWKGGGWLIMFSKVYLCTSDNGSKTWEIECKEQFKSKLKEC